MIINKQIINNLRLAIELAGDGGITPFTTKEETEMYNFLNELEQQINNDTN